MRISPHVAILDACVLAPMPIVDTLLRLAEGPHFYIPKWSSHILREGDRTLRDKFANSPQQVRRRIEAMKRAFPDAMVVGYEDLVRAMTNDPKDRHAMAAAVKCVGQSIVSTI